MSLFPKYIPAKVAKVANDDSATVIHADPEVLIDCANKNAPDEVPPRIEDGEFRSLSTPDKFADEIVKLTLNDLAEQKRLLRLHCPKYAPLTHFEALALKWEVRVCSLESKGIPVQLAEIQAAQDLQLLAFIDELLPLE